MCLNRAGQYHLVIIWPKLPFTESFNMKRYIIKCCVWWFTEYSTLSNRCNHFRQNYALGGKVLQSPPVLGLGYCLCEISQFSCVCVSFLQVLQFPPICPQKYAGRTSGCAKLFLGVCVGAWCPAVDWHHARYSGTWSGSIVTLTRIKSSLKLNEYFL